MYQSEQQKRLLLSEFLFHLKLLFFCFALLYFGFVTLIISKYLLVFIRIKYNCQCEKDLKILMIFIHNIEMHNALYSSKEKKILVLQVTGLELHILSDLGNHNCA